MAKIVVTGGAGFIGSHIVDSFLADGHEVVVIDDLSSGTRDNLAAEVLLHEIDIRDPQVRDLLVREAPDVVVHAAAQISVRLSMEDPVFDTQVNVAGLVNLLHAFQGTALPYFVFISTGGAIYGEQSQFPATEGHAIAPTSVYGLAKRVGEMYLEFWARELGLQHTVLRLSNVYGPRQNPHGEAGVVAIFCQKLLGGEEPIIFGEGKQTRDFIFVRDVARAVKIVAEKRATNTYNIGTGAETSVNELYAHIQTALGKTVEARYEPVRAGEQLRSCIDPELAQREMNWVPQVTIEDGIAQTAQWFAEKV